LGKERKKEKGRLIEEDSGKERKKRKVD